MSKKKIWFLLFFVLFVGALWVDLSPAPAPLRALSFPRFVFTMISLQLLLAVALWGFSKDVWMPEVEHWDQELSRQQTPASSQQKTGQRR